MNMYHVLLRDMYLVKNIQTMSPTTKAQTVTATIKFDPKYLVRAHCAMMATASVGTTTVANSDSAFWWEHRARCVFVELSSAQNVICSFRRGESTGSAQAATISGVIWIHALNISCGGSSIGDILSAKRIIRFPQIHTFVANPRDSPLLIQLNMMLPTCSPQGEVADSTAR